MSCDYCGAPIERSTTAPTTCSFCGRKNDPLPTEVQVPVPVQIVQNVVNVVGAAPAELRELRCPQCKKRLVTAKVDGVDLSGCGTCGGIWIENASARRVLGKPEAIFAEMATRAGDNARNRAPRADVRACPSCDATLDRVSSHGIELDVCTDHGTWFDAYELAMLVRLLRGEKPSMLPPLATGRTIQCATCHTPIAADRANITDRGLQCDACWRKEQGELVATFDKEHEASTGVVVGGVMLGIAAAMLGAAGSR